MQSHLDLVYEQLYTLVDLLMEEAQLLMAHDEGPEALGYRDDLESLVQTVGQFALRLDETEQALLAGEARRMPAHSLNALLEGILGLSELLLNNAEDVLSPRQYQLLQHIYANSYDLRDIVDDVFSR